MCLVRITRKHIAERGDPPPPIFSCEFLVRHGNSADAKRIVFRGKVSRQYYPVPFFEKDVLVYLHKTKHKFALSQLSSLFSRNSMCPFFSRSTPSSRAADAPPGNRRTHDTPNRPPFVYFQPTHDTKMFVEYLNTLSSSLPFVTPVPQAAAAKYNVPAFSADAMDVITHPDVDAVWVCSPSQFHADQVRACLLRASVRERRFFALSTRYVLVQCRRHCCRCPGEMVPG